MGGNAFGAVLGASSFPRLPPAVYAALKSRLLPKIQSLYSFVAIPIEAPEKADYGDIDFVVACPKTELISSPELINVPPQLVQQMIDARFSNPMDGNRTSNFAVPIAQGEWGPLGHRQDEAEKRRHAAGGELFYQVDVNVCTDRSEWERIVFFHSYGDLGMILSLIVKNAGLVLGEKGLRLPNPPHPPVELSQSFGQIMDYMGLEMAPWRAGFKTKREVFEWASTCRFFDPSKFRSQGEGIRKVKAERKMYAEFVKWVMERAASANPGEEVVQESKEMRQNRELKLRDEVLVHFKQKETFDALARERFLRRRVKEVFRGSSVRDWTDLGADWKGVKIVMDAVRERVGGEEGVLRILEAEGEDGVKQIVWDVKEEVSLTIDHPRQRKTGEGEAA